MLSLSRARTCSLFGYFALATAKRHLYFPALPARHRHIFHGSTSVPERWDALLRGTISLNGFEIWCCGRRVDLARRSAVMSLSHGGLKGWSGEPPPRRNFHSLYCWAVVPVLTTARSLDGGLARLSCAWSRWRFSG